MVKLKIISDDPYLEPFRHVYLDWEEAFTNKRNLLVQENGSLEDFSNGHHYFGVQKEGAKYIFREWAPGAQGMSLLCQNNNWEGHHPAYTFSKRENGIWVLEVPENLLIHQQEYKLLVRHKDEDFHRLSPWAKKLSQDPDNKSYNQQLWDPTEPYVFTNPTPKVRLKEPLLVYEAHIGMASEEETVASFADFTQNRLQEIANQGYNTLQLMAIQEHPYYGSFGYHVSNFFAVSSRFGEPEDLKQLIDTAHGLGLAVVMDIVHSHAVKNTLEGPGLFDGTPNMFFHADGRRLHPAWDSLCFDYAKTETLHFLLSNCKFWLEEFHFDGFRFDGVTSMLYYDHGLDKAFTDYSSYFDNSVDKDALVYLKLANELIKNINPNSLSIAEDMSGLPGLATPIKDGGLGFDYRLSMGIPDFWIKTIKEQVDEQWNVNQIFHELTNVRELEQSISYTESHDQALVGDKTIFFRLADKEVYTGMSVASSNVIIDRAIALHKLIRLVTSSLHHGGYLTFMGNEFGHPEWIDFPREGNNWSYKYARRQWSLAKREDLKYKYLLAFEAELLKILKNTQRQDQAIHLFGQEQDQVLAYARGKYLFIINFNPSVSFTGYGIPCAAGDYKFVLSSDDERFGGFERINKAIGFQSNMNMDQSQHQLLCYLPSRTAIVLEQIPIPKIR